ncbi:Y4yA family PLP-dependent enzyme [Brucellaceae bacterium C25G]
MVLSSLQLPPITPRWMQNVIQNNDLLKNIADAVNGSFHLVHADTFAGNLQSFEDVLKKHKIDARVYYAKKANKAGIWLDVSALFNGYVDVASIEEFSHALCHGIQGSHIGVTGASKSNRLLRLALNHNALVAIDALDELDRAIALAQPCQPLRILLRILPPQFPDSRFGLNPSDLSIALQKCVNNRHAVTMEGFSFHLDGYQVQPRASLAFQLINQCLDARKQGLNAHSISIGGGFACSYVKKGDWDRFQQNIDAEYFHSNKTFPKFYPYHQSPSGAAMLDAILQSNNGIRTLSQALNQADISLLMEPGRALVDGAGMSIFPVLGFKQNDEHGLLTVSGLSMSLSEQWKASEFLPDPYLIQRGESREQIPVQAAIGGSSCMEYDMLSWRKISFPARPRFGDLLIYKNTAGYQMDKNESCFHQIPLPPKIVIWQTENGFKWSADQ